MYLRVRLPREPARPRANRGTSCESGRFNALLFDRGWWSSRGPSSVATIASQEEAVTAICDDAQVVPQLRRGQDVLVVTQGTTGSGKSHLLVGSAVHRTNTEITSSDVTLNSLGVLTTSLPALVTVETREDSCPELPHAIPVRSAEFGVLQRCLWELLDRHESGNGVDDTRPSRRVSLKAASFSSSGWTDLLGPRAAVRPLSAFEDATEHTVIDMSEAHRLIHVAWTACTNPDVLSDRLWTRGHLVIQVATSSDQPDQTSRALFIDPSSPPLFDSAGTETVSAGPFYSHTDFVLRSALMGTLGASSTGWLAPWEGLLRLCGEFSAQQVVVLFTTPPSSEITARDVAVLRFADMLRASRKQRDAPSTSPAPRGVIRLAPLDASALTDSPAIVSRPYTVNTTITDGDDGSTPGRSGAYRRLHWQVSPTRRALSSAPPRDRSKSPTLASGARRAKRTHTAKSSRSAASTRTAPSQASLASAGAEAAEATPQVGSRASTATATRPASRRHLAAPSPQRATSALRRAGDVSSLAPQRYLVQEEEARFRVVFEANEHRARDLLLSSFCVSTHRCAPVGLLSLTTLPSPARSLPAWTPTSLIGSPMASRLGALPPHVSPAYTPASSGLSVTGLDASGWSASPPSPYAALARRPAPGSADKVRSGQSHANLSLASSLAHSTRSRALARVQSTEDVPDLTYSRATACSSAHSISASATPQRKASFQGSATGRWRSSVFIEAGLDVKDLKPSATRRSPCVGFAEADRILPVVVGVHREITAQNHFMATELAARTDVESAEAQRRSAIEEQTYAMTKGTPAASTHMKRSAVPSPSRRFFLL